MLNSRYVLKTLRGGGRGRFSQRKHNNFSTLRSAMMLWSSLAPQYHAHHNSIVRQGSSSQQNDRTKYERVEHQIQKQTGVVSIWITCSIESTLWKSDLCCEKYSAGCGSYPMTLLLKCFRKAKHRFFLLSYIGNMIKTKKYDKNIFLSFLNIIKKYDKNFSDW